MPRPLLAASCAFLIGLIVGGTTVFVAYKDPERLQQLTEQTRLLRAKNALLQEQLDGINEILAQQPSGEPAEPSGR